MNKCEKCYHEAICPESELKIDRRYLGKCDYYKRKWEIVDMLIDEFSYHLVLLYLQTVQCKHLCMFCEYKDTCRKMVREEVNSLKIKEQ